ncbi:MAG: CNNM domain-containing protein [Planctomycetia bacterium]|nr:CNNM domain-containing protein [Planctomycetia bacterium]
MITLIIAIAVAMFVSFLCSVMEAALLSLNPGKLALITQKRAKIGKICSDFKKDIEKPIAVILILNTTAHTFGAAIAGAQFDSLFGSRYIWLFSLIFTIVMVQYTEILPKTLGVRFNTFVLTTTAVMLKYSVWIFSPVIALVHLVNSPFEGKQNDTEDIADVTFDELSALTTMARQSDFITPTQEYLLQKIPYLREKPVRDLMVPLSAMKCLSSDMSKEEILSIIKNSLHSRYPVCSERQAESDPNDRNDTFVGIMEVRQMLFLEDDNWQRFIKPVQSIQDDESQLHIAENIAKLDSKLLLVRNGEGKVVGMLTTNNLIMKLFQPNTGSV